MVALSSQYSTVAVAAITAVTLLLTAVIAALTAATRQREALGAERERLREALGAERERLHETLADERERLRETLEDERDRADVAELRGVLDEAANVLAASSRAIRETETYLRLGQLTNSPPTQQHLASRLDRVEESREAMEQYLHRIALRLGKEDAIWASFNDAWSALGEVHTALLIAGVPELVENPTVDEVTERAVSFFASQRAFLVASELVVGSRVAGVQPTLEQRLRTLESKVKGVRP